jgi:hypothetical protein
LFINFCVASEAIPVLPRGEPSVERDAINKMLERFPAKWKPVRVKKTRQIKI